MRISIIVISFQPYDEQFLNNVLEVNIFVAHLFVWGLKIAVLCSEMASDSDRSREVAA
jgi:hypothetical protein